MANEGGIEQAKEITAATSGVESGKICDNM